MLIKSIRRIFMVFLLVGRITRADPGDTRPRRLVGPLSGSLGSSLEVTFMGAGSGLQKGDA